MPRARTSIAGQIVEFFRSAPLETAELILGLCRDALYARRQKSKKAKARAAAPSQETTASPAAAVPRKKRRAKRRKKRADAGQKRARQPQAEPVDEGPQGGEYSDSPR